MNTRADKGKVAGLSARPGMKILQSMLIAMSSQDAEAAAPAEAEKADTCAAFARSSVGRSILVKEPLRLQKPLLKQKQRRLAHAHDVHSC